MEATAFSDMGKVVMILFVPNNVFKSSYQISYIALLPYNIKFKWFQYKKGKIQMTV